MAWAPSEERGSEGTGHPDPCAPGLPLSGPLPHLGPSLPSLCGTWGPPILQVKAPRPLRELGPAPPGLPGSRVPESASAQASGWALAGWRPGQRTSARQSVRPAGVFHGPTGHRGVPATAALSRG